ncbi:hypothetical protein GCM10023091_30840 [Ravibacter arvi]|uniref:AAA domain-containing protein n=1 Tax=Ravibacter arvi TaxID=2051041 RepID=A0ABP8M4F5_9BACT
MTRLVSEQFADLHEVDFLLNTPSFEVLHQVIQRRKRIALCDAVDPRFERVNLLSKRLRNIARTVDFIEEERGSRSLFVGYPFVRGKFSTGQVVHAPLLFFPVSLELDKGQWCLKCDSEAGAHLNRSFALAYGQFNEVAIPDVVLEADFDEFPTNITIFRTELYKWLKESPFVINFNQDLFEDKLRHFDAVKAKDLEAIEKSGELKLYPEAVLGVFPQTGSYLEEDYNFLLEHDESFSLNDFSDPDISESNIKEEDLLTPFSVDASQEMAQTKVRRGQHLVVQGPPGTGKSQLICNLMADYAARGKRVLLVCQKRAALDVVESRMKAAGFGNFTALIHDHLTDRSALYRQMAGQIEQLEAFRKENYSLDAVYLEREFLKESRLTDRLVEELTGFKNALFDDSVAGASVKELYLTSDPQGPDLVLTNLLKSFPMDKTEEIIRAAGRYFTYALKFDDHHSWTWRRDFSELNQVDYKRIQELIRSWPETFSQLEKRFTDIFSTGLSRKFLVGTDHLKEILAEVERSVNQRKVYDLFVRYLAQPAPTAVLLEKISSLTGQLAAREGVEGHLENARLEVMLGKVEKAVSAKKEVVGGLWWDWFSKDKEEVSRLSGKQGLTTNLADLGKLARRIKNRMAIEDALADDDLGFDRKQMVGTTGILHQYGLFLDDANEAAAAVARTRSSEWAEVITGLAARTRDVTEFQNLLKSALAWIQSWEKAADEMDQWLVPQQFNGLVAQPAAFGQRLAADLEEDFDHLVEIDTMWKDFSHSEQVLMERLKERGKELNLIAAGDYQRLLDNSLRLAWIEQIERRYPVLRSVSSLKMAQWEEDLQRSVERKQALSAEIVRMKLREEVYGDVEKNRLGNTVTYREVHHQLTKKRRIWPIRKLLSQFSEDVFRLVPCWMVSPESASVIFPMEKGFFDLVIFDEASQCYAEYALPAAYRGRQLVVAGDSKQLQPTDLYKVRYEPVEDDEAPAELEAESLLDLAGISMPSHQLNGHYRSLSLDLIQFSNRHFYEGTLRLLPDFQYANTAAPGISYHKVEGLWVDGTNSVEAAKVLELLRELSSQSKSVGVVTFNYPQQQLIAQRVEESGLVIPDLFFKNIENVQGDERDVIIFSVGYAPDRDGRLTMQFGTLNTRGGENRLNVAVTRAKEKVHVVTSLSPHQLKVENTLHEGPKLLKAYLEYAKRVSDGDFLPSPTEVTGKHSEWLLKKQLVKKIPGAMFELPFADLTVKADNSYQALVLTDDDQYHHSTTPKEPHAYLPILLRKKGWPFKRIYSREFWNGKV